MLFFRILVFLIGLQIVWHTIKCAVVTFVLPRSASHWITSVVFRFLRFIFNQRLRWAHTYAERAGLFSLTRAKPLLGDGSRRRDGCRGIDHSGGRCPT